MTQITYPIDGACMCGEIRMRVSAPPIITMACHCTGCQKLSASAFSLTAMLPAEAFEVLEGEPVPGALHGEARYMYCPNCLNWLYTQPPGIPFINIRPALFDAPAWSTPFIETWVSKRLPWATTSAKHAFDQYPPPEKYGELMQAYAEWAGAA